MIIAPWLITAIKEINIQEIAGESHNARILEYDSYTSLKATTDEVPWCSSFACFVLEQTGVQSPKSAWAADFLKWGVQISGPEVGCIVVLKRGVAGHHVGFYWAETPTHLLLLGGNQHDSVNISHFNKADLLGYRMDK